MYIDKAQMGSKVNIALPGVREDITEMEVSAAMDSIVSSK
jgi:hypothetical protein